MLWRASPIPNQASPPTPEPVFTSMATKLARSSWHSALRQRARRGRHDHVQDYVSGASKDDLIWQEFWQRDSRRFCGFEARPQRLGEQDSKSSRPVFAMLQPRKCLPTLSLTRRCFATAARQYARSATETSISEVTATAFEAPPSLRDENISKMKTYKPRTPGLRHLKRPVNDHLWKGRAYLPLTYPRKGHGIGGRNNSGRVTMRHRGGGHKRRIRIVDFSRMDAGIHTVERIEHDPGRSAHIALVMNAETKKKSYILAAEGMRAGDDVQSYRRGLPAELMKSMGGVLDPAIVAAKTAWRGNCLPLRMVPPGTFIYNVGLYRGKRGQLCRSAGTYAQVIGGHEDAQSRTIYVQVRLQSGEVRKIHREACATIGIASNGNHNRAQLGKAGRSRWLGIRPTVRGLAMNANEHPHGGGRGKSKGNRHPVSIWGRTLVRSHAAS